MNMRIVEGVRTRDTHCGGVLPGQEMAVAHTYKNSIMPWIQTGGIALLVSVRISAGCGASGAFLGLRLPSGGFLPTHCLSGSLGGGVFSTLWWGLPIGVCGVQR